MAQKFGSFGELMASAKNGNMEVSIVEYRGRDVKCLWWIPGTFHNFTPKEDGFICLFNDESFKVYGCFAGSKAEIPDIDCTKIINATGHDIHVINDRGDCLRTFLASPEHSIQMSERVLNCPDIEGIRVCKREYEKIGKLPMKEENVFYIVSWIVKSHYPDRTDFICVDGVVYGSKPGEVLGCTGFRR